MLKNKRNTKRGITLISLVITIIILLILATVAITLAVDSDGLFGKAGTAANTWNTSVADENTELENLMLMANSVGGTTGGETEEQITFSLGNVEITTTKGITWKAWLNTVDEEELTNLGVRTVIIDMFDGANWGECDETKGFSINFGPPIGASRFIRLDTGAAVKAGDEIVDGVSYESEV